MRVAVALVVSLVATACSATLSSAPATTATADAATVAPSSAPNTAAAARSTATSPITSTTTAPTSTTTSPTTSTTTASTTTTTLPAWPRTITMAFAGDTLPHSPLWRRAERNAAEAGVDGFDFDPMLAGLAPVLDEVDLAVCHLETPIAPLGEEFSTSPRYGVPAEIVDAIAAAGFDRCSTASNHTADRGTAGIDRTVDVLESRGLGQSGMARTPAEIEPAVFEVDGVDVSHLSYTFSYNGLRLPADEQWRSATIDPGRIIADARTARDLGADIVLVSMHWGNEGVSEPTGAQRAIADEITATGLVDLVIGHHAHVLQPIERVNGTWVLFGLGNIVSNLPTSDRWPAASQDAAIVTVAFEVAADGTVVAGTPSAVATWVDKDAGWVVRLVDDELARADLTAGQRGRLERSRERTDGVLGPFLPVTDNVTESG